MRTLVICSCAALLAAALAPPSARAQTAPIPSALTLDAALRLALERNPTLAAARSAVESAEGRRLGAASRPNPALTVGAEGYPLFEASRPGLLDGQEISIRLDQEIETAGRRRLRSEAADTGVAVAEALAVDERRRLALDVRRAYFAVVLAKTEAAVAETTLEEIDRALSVNQARFGEGEISGVEVRRLQVERLRFVDDRLAAQLALRNAKSALLAMLDAPDLAFDVDVTEPLAQPPAAVEASLAAARSQALAARPDLAAARHAVERADTETRLQRALRTPNLTVGGGYRRDFGTDAVVVGVTVPLPIFNRNGGAIASAAAEGRRARQLAVAAANQVRLEVQQALNAVEISAARVQYIEQEYLGNAEQTRDTVRASYQLGAADLIDFLDAQRGFRDTVRTYNRALYEHRLSVFQLAAAVGAPIAGGE